MQIRWTNILVALVVMFLLAVVLRQCQQEPEVQVVVRERIDTVRIEVPVIQVETADPVVEVVYRDRTTTDTAQVSRLMNEIDGLNRQLRDLQARRTFALDTITARGDTVWVECDETNKRIQVDVRPAPVEKVRIVRDTLRIEQADDPLLQPYVQASAVMDATSRWGAQGNAGVRLNMGRSQVKPFADALFNTITGAQVRLGMEIVF